MEIPIIISCLIHKAIKCFKYLLINGLEDPTNIMSADFSYDIDFESNYGSGWDCMAVAIYYGDLENVKILEAKVNEKGNRPAHIEAAILSYRNKIVKEIINKMKEKNEKGYYINYIFHHGLKAAIKNNNIKGAELLLLLLINQRADISPVIDNNIFN